MSLFEYDKSGERTPLTLVTGFLGSGKTTLLKRLLANARMARSLVLVNEFGEVGLDHRLMESVAGDMVLLASGCVCCSIKGELEQTLRGIAARRQRGEMPPFDRVLVETTGLADPGPILQLLLNWPTVSHDYRLDAVLCTVDALHGERQLDEHPEALRQAAVADRLLITKADLSDDERVGALAERLERLNPGATQLDARHGSVDPDRLFGVAPRAASSAGVLARWLGVAGDGGAPRPLQHAARRPADAQADASIGSFVLDCDAPLEWDAFTQWLGGVRAAWGDQLLRVKGILDVAGEDAPLVIHGVHRTFHSPTLLAGWAQAQRRSQMVFITRGPVRADIEASWREFLAGGTK
jgi:G3E family GTPase